MDARTLFFYQATLCIGILRANAGNLFWSVVVYDPQTRSELQTSQLFPSKNSKRNPLVANADGSVDIYFGPQAPAGKEPNWIESVPGKGWYTILRLYGPLEPWFDKTWRPGEIDLVP
jgi:hypothetical protein